MKGADIVLMAASRRHVTFRSPIPSGSLDRRSNMIGCLPDMSDATPRSARIVSRVVHLLTSVALACGLAMPAAAQGSVQPVGVAAYTVTPKRITARGAALTGLI